MNHPCSNHLSSCDHCYVCDVLGVCCASLSAKQRARLEASDPARRGRLHEAIARDAQTTQSLPELVRQEALLPPAAARLGLLAAPPANPLADDSRKEALYVIPARSN
jgi:hypothetical protein